MSDERNPPPKPRSARTGRNGKAPNEPSGTPAASAPPAGGGVVLANGRSVVHAGSGGTVTSPDVCRTPGKCPPVAYSNVARSRDAANTAATVFVNGHPICHEKSIFARSSGDEAGRCGGVRSGTIQGRAEFLTASGNVFVEGLAVVRQGDLMVSNNRNTPPMPLMQPGGATARAGALKGPPEPLEAAEEPLRLDFATVGRHPGIPERGSLEQAIPGATYAELLDSDRRRLPVGGGEEQGACRVAALPVPDDEGEALLRLVDEREGHYLVPLGPAFIRERDADPKPERNLLVPVLPRAYTTPDLDPAHCAPLRPGWLYVFRGRHLWRELEVLAGGRLRDVNLHVHAGRDRREASGERDDRLLLPWRLDGEEQELWIAWSEVQWSWARINQLGGMDPEDLRLDPEALPPMPEDQGYTAEQIDQARAARLQRLDLSGWSAGFPGQPPQGRTARIENVDAANQRLEHLRRHQGSGLPVVYLHDPVGIACNNALAWQLLLEDLIQALEAAMDEHDTRYRTAALAWQTYFNDELWRRKPRRKGQRGPTHYADNSELARRLRSAAEYLDRDELRDILRIDGRQDLRRHMRELQDLQAEWLRGCHAGQPIDPQTPDFVSFEAALRDWALLPAPEYLRLWDIIAQTTAFLAYEPASLDGILDLREDRQMRKPQDDPGLQYLVSLLQPDHPLHALLFPDEQQVDLATGTVQASNEPGQGQGPDGRFRPEDFAAALSGAGRLALSGRIADGAVKLGERTIGDFLNYMNAALSRHRDGARPLHHPLMRLALASGHPWFEGVRLVPANGLLEPGEVIVGMRVVYLMADGRARREDLEARPKDNAIRLENGKGQLLGQLEAERLSRFPGLKPSLTLSELEGLLEEQAPDGTRRVRVEALVARPDSPLAEAYARHKYMQPHQGFAALEKAGKALPVLVAVLETINLIKIERDLAAEPTDKALYKSRIALASVIYASIQVSVIYAGEDTIISGFEQTGQRVGAKLDYLRMHDSPYYQIKMGKAGRGLGEFITRKEWFYVRNQPVKSLTLAGAGLTAAGAAMAYWDAYSFAALDDDDAAAWSAVQGTALSGLAVATIMEGSAVFLGLGPIGWALLGISLAAGIAAYLSLDTPLERWAKLGPFARDRDKRMTGDYAGMDEAAAGRALMGLLLSPSVRIERDWAEGETAVVARVAVPGFRDGQEELDVRLTVERWWVNARGQGGHALGPQEVMRPWRITPWRDESGRRIGFQYHYRLPEARKLIVRACARRITDDGISLPEPPGGHQRAEVVDTIVDQLPGWVVARPLRFRP